MNKLKETEVKPTVYTVYDKNIDAVVGIYTDKDVLLTDVRAYCLKNYGNRFPFSKLYQDTKQKFPVIVEENIYHYNFQGPHWYSNTKTETIRHRCEGLYITDDLGDIVEDFKSDAPRKYSYDNPDYISNRARREQIESRLVSKKGNPNKIKPSYTFEADWSDYSQEMTYVNARIGYFQRITTYQIHRLVANVLKEEGEPEFRGKVRNTPNSWDDKSNGIYDTYKSWKHNSKRRKQWKAEPSIVI